MNALTLYQIEDTLAALVNCDGAVPDDQLAEYLSELAKANEEAVAKRDNVIRFIRHLDLQMSNVDAEITRLSALKASYESGKKRVEKYVVSVLEQLPEPKRGARKLEGTVGVLSLAKNPDKVEITDPASIPNEFQDVTVVMAADKWLSLLLRSLGHDPSEWTKPRFDKTDGTWVFTREIGPAEQVRIRCDDETKKITFSPRKSDIKAAIQSGGEVAGADIAYGDNRLVVK